MTEKTQLLIEAEADGEYCRGCYNVWGHCRLFNLYTELENGKYRRHSPCLAAEAAAKEVEDTIMNQDNIIRAQQLIIEGLKGKLEYPELREAVELAKGYKKSLNNECPKCKAHAMLDDRISGSDDWYICSKCGERFQWHYKKRESKFCETIITALLKMAGEGE